MRSRFFGIGFLGVTLFVSSALRAQEAAIRPVTINVQDPVGTAIARAQIRLVPAADPASATLVADDQGTLHLKLKAGSYVLFISAQGFQTAAQQIDVAAAKNAASDRQFVKVKLQIGQVGSPVVVHPTDSLVLTADVPRARGAYVERVSGAATHHPYCA